MKKLLIILAVFMTYSSFSQNLDTLITKNNFTYRLERKESNNVFKLTNLTTEDNVSKLVNPKHLSKDYFAEGQRIVKYTKNNDKMNIENHFINIFKEILKACELQNFNHLRPITFFISVSSNGAIADLLITMSPDLFDIIGLDKIIEFESRIRNEYKFHPFLNNEVKIVPLVISIKKDKLNEMFK